MPDLIQRSFTSGELAPSLRARTDITKAQSGLALCENMIVKVQGGAYSRPGLRFADEIRDSSVRGRLLPFSFNTEQSYALVFENLTMRIIKNGAYLMDLGIPVEVVTPYAAAQISRIQITQTADTVTICHPSHDPMNLGRVSETNWTLTAIDYAPTVAAPLWAVSSVLVITGITQAAAAVVTVASTVGILTGNTANFAAVGGMVEINGLSSKITVLSPTTFSCDDIDSTAFTPYASAGTATFGSIDTIGASGGAGTYLKTYSYVITAVDIEGVESLQSLVVSMSTRSLTTVVGIQLTWVAGVNIDYYRIYKEPSISTGVYGWIGESRTTTFSDFNIAPITSDAPPLDRQPFVNIGDKPSVVNYYAQRQIFANTTNSPQTIFGTQVGNFRSLRKSNPTRDDDSVTLTINAKEVNEIRHLLSLDSLIVMTSAMEWKVTEGVDQVLTPSTVGIKTQSKNGCSWVPPVIINDSVIFVQEKGARVRDLGYQLSADKFLGSDISLMAAHLFEGFTIEEMAYSSEPYGIVWCVRSDGVVVALTYQKEQQVWGWHHHTTDGFFESVAVVSEGNRDAVYFIVRRVVNGVTKRYIERMEVRDTSSAANSFCVDSGLTYNGAPATVISGLGHLEGKVVAVLADGNEVIGLTVNAGSITLPIAASVVQVGLSYVPVIETLDIDQPGAQSIKGDVVSVSRVVIEVESSRGGFIGPKLSDDSIGTMLEIKPRFDSDGYDSIALRTYKAEIQISPEWSKGGGIRIEQRSPLPLAILSVIPKVDVGG